MHCKNEQRNIGLGLVHNTMQSVQTSRRMLNVRTVKINFRGRKSGPAMAGPAGLPTYGLDALEVS